MPKVKQEKSVINIKTLLNLDQINTEIIKLVNIKTPPIVGVPTFSIIWRSGPSALIGCPSGCKEDKDLIIKLPKIREKNKEVNSAPPVLKVI